MLLANLEILQYRSHTSTISQGLQVHQYSTYMITYQILIHRHSFITSRRTMEEVLTSDGVCHPLDDEIGYGVRMYVFIFVQQHCYSFVFLY